MKATKLQHVYFWSGIALLYAVSFTRIDYYSQHEFFMHRIQHSILHHMAPFLIALSGFSRPYLSKLTWITPSVAALSFTGLIVFWLIPPVHFIAMLDWRWYMVMNWSMAINGLLFWNVALNGDSSPGSRIIMMLAVIPPQIVIGALIVFSPHPLYPIYAICGRAFLGVSSMADQQIGGLILWINGAMMSLIGVLIVVKREMVMAQDASVFAPHPAPLP